MEFGKLHLAERKFREAEVYVFLAIVSTVANFLYCASFGLYEDDWSYIAGAFRVDPQAWLQGMRNSVRSFSLGRPVQEGLLYLSGYLGNAAHSIAVLYVLAALLTAGSVLLFYRVLRQRCPISLSLMGGLLFAISPLSTIRPFLDGTLWGAPGLIFLFGAILIYSHRRYAIGSYLVAVLALLTYEPMYLLFFAAPFFRRGPRKWYRTAIHIVVCGLILLVYLYVRRQFAEARLLEASGKGPLELAEAVARSALVFSAGSFESYVYAIYVGVRDADVVDWIVSILLLALTICMVRRLPGPKIRRTTGARATRRWWWMRRVLAPAVGLLVTGYILAYFGARGAGYVLAGRDTRFCDAAIAGSSLLVGGLIWYPLANWRTAWATRVARAGACVFCLCLLLFSFVVQDDYRSEWKHMTLLLAEVMSQAPDANSNTLLMIQRPWYEEPLFPRGGRRPAINFQPHGYQRALPGVFASTAVPEVLLVYDNQWRSALVEHPDGKLYWPGPSVGASSTNEKRPVEQIIFFRDQADGNLKRIDTPFTWKGRQLIQARPAVDPPSYWRSLPHSRLWPLVFPHSPF